MKINYRLANYVVAAAMLIVPAAARGACSASDPAGFFEGRANSREAGALDVSLNLECTNGQYAGELATPLGPFTIARGGVSNGRLRLTFAGAAEITVDAAVTDGLLRGSFTSGEDGGTLELRRTGGFRPAQSTKPSLDLDAKQWREDIQHFAAELPRRHVSPFEFTPRAKWLEAVAELERNVATFDRDEIYVALNRLANRIGDAHTYVEFPDDTASLPVRIRQFGSDYRIVAAIAQHEQAVGARLVSIDEMPVAAAAAKLREMAPVGETEMLADSRIEGFLSMGMLLHGAGITRDRNAAVLGIVDDAGSASTITVRAAELPAKPEWKFAYVKRPLSLERAREPFWFVYLPESKMIYCSFRGYDGLASGARALMAAIKEHRPQKLAIDLRRNGGGDFTEGLKHLVEPIRKNSSINRKNRLFILIGPDTFSAAMSNAAHFRQKTNALLVGTTIGERPNSNQEPREFRLPNSRLVVRYSTKRYRFTNGRENLIGPDREIVQTWEAYKAGRDLVLEWVASVPAVQ